MEIVYRNARKISDSFDGWRNYMAIVGDKRAQFMFANLLFNNSFFLQNHSEVDFPSRHSIRYCEEQAYYLIYIALNDRSLSATERTTVKEIFSAAVDELNFLLKLI